MTEHLFVVPEQVCWGCGKAFQRSGNLSIHNHRLIGPEKLFCFAACNVVYSVIVSMYLYIPAHSTDRVEASDLCLYIALSANTSPVRSVAASQQKTSRSSGSKKQSFLQI